ncbi:MAG: hypothetical protein V7K68_27915 [Nostoc sp.]|uniref:hypothetical protein n=1 Tax=Nostoc sp. TaxID=1180 RepID=UPI002FF6596A
MIISNENKENLSVERIQFKIEELDKECQKLDKDMEEFRREKDTCFEIAHTLELSNEYDHDQSYERRAITLYEITEDILKKQS